MEMDQIEIEERPDQDQRHTLVAKGYNVIWLLIVILVGFIGYLATDKSVAREEGIEAVDKPPKLYIVTAANMLQHPASKDIQTIENLNVSTSVYGGVPLKIFVKEEPHPSMFHMEKGPKEWMHFVKIDFMRKIDKIVPNPDHDLVLFVDAFDTLVTIPSQEIVRRFFALERKVNMNNTVVFNGVSQKCFPFELWEWHTDEVITLVNGVNVTGSEVCDNFRTRFGGDNPGLNSGVYMGRARDVATVNQLVWDNRNVSHMTDQSLFIQATKVLPNMIVDSNSTFLITTHERDISSDPLCESHDVDDAGVLHFTGRKKDDWITKCREFYLGSYLNGTNYTVDWKAR